jgi:uncharacterized protein YndB with AHSA1/START domain
VTLGAPAQTLTLRRTYACPREDVFKAWTEPDAIVKWFGGETGKAQSVAVDLRVGGAYRFTLESPVRGVGTVGGVFQEVEIPERLVYTWQWEVEGTRASLVTVEFRDRDGETELVLTHEGLGTEESLAFHGEGWTSSLEALGHVLEPA